MFLDLGGGLVASVGLEVLLLLLEPLPRLIEVVTEDGSYSSSFRFLFFFSRASMGAAGAYERRYARELREVSGRGGDMITHLLIHTCDRVRSLLRFQQVIRELNQIVSELSISHITGGGVGWRSCTDQGSPCTLLLIVLEFISVVIFEAPGASLLVEKGAGVFVERYLARRCGRRRGSGWEGVIGHRLRPVREVFLVKALCGKPPL